MKNLLTLPLLILITIFSITSCESHTNSESIQGSGNVVDVKIDFTNFSKIEAGHAFNITTNRGDDYSVVLKVDDNIVKYLEVTKEDNRLKLFLEKNNSYNDVTLIASITLPDIESVDFSGAVSATINNFEFEHDLSVQLSGASSLTSSIKTGDVAFKLSGASKVTFYGSGDNINANISGASSLQLGNFSIVNANINLSGASSSTIDNSGLLNANLSGASSLYYHGNPTMGNIETSGASTIQKLP